MAAAEIEVSATNSETQTLTSTYKARVVLRWVSWAFGAAAVVALWFIHRAGLGFHSVLEPSVVLVLIASFGTSIWLSMSEREE